MRSARSLIAAAVLAALAISVSADSPPELTATTFDELVGADAHTLVEFHAPWCTACSAFAPVLHAAAAELARERPDVQFARVDGDAQPELRTRFAIDEAPSLLLFPAGKAADRSQAAHFTGELNRAELIDWARGALAGMPLLSGGAPAAKPAKQPTKPAKQAAAAAKPAKPAKPDEETPLKKGEPAPADEKPSSCIVA